MPSYSQFQILAIPCFDGHCFYHLLFCRLLREEYCPRAVEMAKPMTPDTEQKRWTAVY